MRNALLTAVIACLVVTVPGAAHGKPSTPQHEKKQSIVYASVTQSAVASGDAVKVRGKTNGTARRVTLHRLYDSGWKPVRTVTTSPDGGFTFEVPTDWYGDHTYRLTVAASKTHQKIASPLGTLTVRPLYAPARGGDWTLMQRTARWDGCSEITWAVSTAHGGAQQGSDADLLATTRATIAEVARATGIRFVEVAPTANRALVDADADTSENPDLTIGWGTTDDLASLHPWAPREALLSVAGRTGQRAATDDRGRAATAFTRGGVLLNIDRLDTLPLGADTDLDVDSWRGLLTNEVGNVLGLGNAESPEAVMAADTHQARLSEADLDGFRQIGAHRGCLA